MEDDFKMNVKLEKTENNNEVKLNFTVEANVFEDSMKKIYSKNAKYFTIPGFRKGRAPMNAVERYYGSEIFYEDAFNDVFVDVYAEALKENNIDAVTRPDVDITVMEKGKDLEFSVTVGVKPEVKLGKYKGVEIEKKEYKVTAKDVEEELSKMQERNSRLVSVTDRAVKSGDTTVIDFEGFCDGNAFDGGKAENHELVIGSNTFIPGFEDQVIGMKIDEEKEINVKFPDEYFSKDLAGKDAMFKVKLHEIKVKELPTLDDEFAKDVSEFDTLEELKADLKAKKEESNASKAKNEMEEEAVKNAVSASEVEISDNMVELELDNMVQDMDRRLSYQGLKFDQYLKMLGKSMADFRTESRETAKDSIKTRLVLEAIAKDIKVEVKDEDVKAKVAELANTYGRKEEELMENEELKEQVKTSLETEKTIAYLLDNAKATVKKAEKKEAKADSSEKEDKKETAKKTK
jgi:trigger factor